MPRFKLLLVHLNLLSINMSCSQTISHEHLRKITNFYNWNCSSISFHSSICRRTNIYLDKIPKDANLVPFYFWLIPQITFQRDIHRSQSYLNCHLSLDLLAYAGSIRCFASRATVFPFLTKVLYCKLRFNGEFVYLTLYRQVEKMKSFFLKILT